jgi:hypothetical protein
MKYKSLIEFLDYVKKTHPGQEEFHQAFMEPYILRRKC